jgi:hypothetical protein
LHQWRAVAVVERLVLVGVVHLVGEQFRTPTQLADKLPRIGIDQQLVGIEAVSGLRFERAVDAIAINGAGAGGRKIPVPDLVGVLRQLNPLQFGLAAVIEQA